MFGRSRRYDGFVDGTEDGVVRGWAIDFKRPRQTLAVELSTPDQVFFERADIERDDLKKFGFGGIHAFRFKCAGSVAAGTVMHCRIANTDFELANSPVTITSGIGNKLAAIPPSVMMSSFYRAVLGREIDESATEFYGRLLNQLSDIEPVFSNILKSEEFRLRHGASETRATITGSQDATSLEAVVEELLFARLAQAGFQLDESFRRPATSDMSEVHILEALQIILGT